MFDLNQALSDWRRQMATAGVDSQEVLDELESHLRNEIECRMESGSAAEEAFREAVRALGDPKTLRSEFAKGGMDSRSPVWHRTRFWQCIGLICYLSPLVMSAPRLWDGMNGLERVLGIGAVALTCCFLLSGMFLHRYLPVIRDQRLRSRIQFAAFIVVLVWCGLFAYVVLPRLDGPVGLLTVITLWALSPLALFGGVIAGLDDAARRLARS